MIQPRALERLGAVLGQTDAGGEQVGVVTEPVRFGHQHFEIVAHQRLAARKPHCTLPWARASFNTRSQASVSSSSSALVRAKSTGL